MIFLAILDCKEKGLKESTKICSKYLNQIGHKSFIGNLSTNNFKNMIEELNENITKNNSISIFRIKKDSYKLVQHFGHNNRLDQNGLYAFKLKDEMEMKKYKEEPTSIPYQAIKEVIAIAGYFHDLGKGNAAFQNMLNSSRKITEKSLSKKFIFEDEKDEDIKKEENWYNLIRHEVLSYIILKNVINNGYEKDGKQIEFNDSNFFEVFSDNTKIEELFENVVSSNESNKRNIINEFHNKIIEYKQSKTDVDSRFGKQIEGFDFFSELRFEENTENKSSFEKNFANNSFFINLILFLVLTHHRLPELDKIGNNYLELFSISNHYNEKYTLYHEYYFKFFITCHKEDNGDVFNGKNWNKLLSSSCKRLDGLLKKYNILNCINIKKSIFEYSLTHGRLSLITSDYYQSKMKVVKDEDRINEIIKNNESLANIETINNGYNSGSVENLKPADTLNEHLMKVGCESYKVTPDILIDDFKNEKHYSFITEKDRKEFINKKKKEYEANQEIEDLKRFNWQYKTMNSLDEEKFKNKPFFGISVAGTGSGKTNANFLTMMALDDNPRFTCALGLRTLTLQSYEAYQENKEIKNATALFMGRSLDSEIVAKYDEVEKKEIKKTDIENKENYTGSDSQKMFNDDNFEILSLKETEANYEFTPNKIYNDWFDILDEKSQRLIHAPIAIMTIDNISKGVQHGRGHNTLNMNRTITSDLILDEIDDYSDNDMATILKLVYLTGLSGRKVLLSSATVNEVIVHSLFNAYKKGIEQRALFFQKDIEFGYGLISQYPEINKFEVYKEKNKINFKEKYTDFLSNLKEAMQDSENEVNKNRTQRNKFELLNLPKEAIESDCFDKLLEKSIEYSNNFYTNIRYNDLKKDKKLSIGFVRFNNIEYSQEFCKYIIEKDISNTKILILNYHSKMMGIDRYRTEAFLNNVLKRKQSSDCSHDIENFPNLKNHKLLETIECYDEENIIILVSSTNILEVGRDHDYDWAILEYQNTKSLIQSIGRVRRHRTIETEDKNIGIMGFHMKSFKKNKESEGIINGYKNFGTLDTEEKLFNFSELKSVQVNCDYNDYKDFFKGFCEFNKGDLKSGNNFSSRNSKKQKGTIEKNKITKTLPPKCIVDIDNLSNISSLRLSEKEYCENRGLKVEQLRLIEMFSNLDFEILTVDDFTKSSFHNKNIQSYFNNEYVKINGNYTKKFPFRGSIYRSKTFTLNYYNKKEERFNIENYLDYCKLEVLSAKTIIRKQYHEYNIEFKKIETKNTNKFLLEALYPEKEDVEILINEKFKNKENVFLLNDLFYSFNYIIYNNDKMPTKINYIFNLGLTNEK